MSATEGPAPGAGGISTGAGGREAPRARRRERAGGRAGGRGQAAQVRAGAGGRAGEARAGWAGRGDSDLRGESRGRRRCGRRSRKSRKSLRSGGGGLRRGIGEGAKRRQGCGGQGGLRADGVQEAVEWRQRWTGRPVPRRKASLFRRSVCASPDIDADL